MFTVVICDRHIIDDCYNKYHLYLKPFFENDGFAFCEWNTNGETLEDALPGLANIIHNKKEWRAIVVNDSYTWSWNAVNKFNPFDYVDSKRKKYVFPDFEHIREFREKELETLDKALSNPLTKLSVWLCGAPVSVEPSLCYEAEKEGIEKAEDGKTYYELLEKMQLRPTDVELDWCKEQKYRKLSEKFELQGELFTPPVSVLTIAERTKNVDDEKAELVWRHHTEFDYSQFYLDNLYPEKLRYLIYDVSYIKGRRNENKYFNFLASVLLLATNECPNGALRSNRVYKLSVNIDSDCVRTLCNRYNSKLYATLSRIDDISSQLREKEKQPIDKEVAMEVFESDIKIPIEVVSNESINNMKAKYNRIGLSRDCPQDEYGYWDNQYHSISKYFIRFLREPRRAVKTATKEDFRKLNKIDDDRAARLNEYQKEDILYILDEEERNMVSTRTSQIFNTAMYNEKMAEADKEIRKGIARRMTKAKTVLIAVVAAVAYLFGFLPLIFSSFNSIKTTGFAFAVAGIMVGLFLLIGFIYLFILRRKLVNRFKHFNYVMSGILKEIKDGVDSFSKYLSHACNVMREFSVLNYSENIFRKKQHILKNHKRIIGDKITEVNDLFAAYVSSDDIRLSYEAEPYDYDFTAMKEYEYPMPYADVNREVDFIQQGNRIRVPVDFIESITVEREDLYD